MNEQALALRYSVLIQWSDEDQVFIVTLPEWQDRLIGAAGHGATHEEALATARISLEMLISIAVERGETLPEPHQYPLAA